MLNFLFGMQGRVERASFCLFAAIGFLVLLALFSLLWFYEIIAGNPETGGPVPWPTSPEGIAAAGLWFLTLCLLCLSGLAVSLKRLHDRDKSWWWLLVFVFAPNIFSSLGRMWHDTNPDEGDIALVFDVFALALFVWAFVELACLKGTTGGNRFGPDPLVRTG